MASGDSVTYTKRESLIEIFPDNPAYKWSAAMGGKSAEEKNLWWYKKLKKRFETFEHDKKSSIYRYYGHDYDDESARVIKMPNGSMSSGNVNRMTEQLPEALEYRTRNFDNPQKNGWRIFEKITGKYDVEAADEETLKERLRTLGRFTELIKEDEFLTRYDPLTNKEAITQIGAEGLMNPIEYTFPLGIENTDFLHYLIYEPELIRAEIENESQIDDIVRYEILNYIDIRSEPLMPKRGIGVVMSKHGNTLRPHIGYIQGILGDIVGEYNELLENDGVKAVSKLLATMELPNTQDEINEDVLVESYKKISVGALLKKVKSKALLKRLNRIKPPSEGRAGGVTWPVSAGGDYMLWITTDPFEMITKSTGRKWSERNASCENWDGCYAEGPVSDVKYGNCIVWVYKKGDEEYRHEIGRFLLRWGESYKEGAKIGFDIGVEAQVYPKDPRESPWGFNLLGAIGNILKDAGLLNYDTCRTPYKFMGYSDKAGGGKIKINYDSKIFLKGQGEVEVGNANALVSMASDESLSYADSGYVLNYGNSQALLALAQNPVVWIYENTIRRLFTRALDLEEGSQIFRFLIDSSVANFDWITGTLDTVEIFDENYLNPLNISQSYLGFLLRSPLCTDEAHRQILQSHPGFEGLSGNSIPLWALAYLNLSSWHMADNPILTTAPSDILDSITDEVIQKHFMHSQLGTGVNINADFYDNIIINEPQDMKRFKRFGIKMLAMKQLIYQPKLSLKSYGKLLTDFNKIWNKRLNNGGEFDKQLNILKKHFAITLCLPLQNHDDWGYLNSFGSISLGMQNTDSGFRDISTIVDGNEIHYPIYSRQSAGTYKRMMDIYPELIKSNFNAGMALEILNIDPDTVGEDSKVFQGLMLRNVRDAGAFKELFKNPEVPRFELLNRLTNPKKQSESIVNPFLNARNYGLIYRGVRDKAGLQYSYTPEIDSSTWILRDSMPGEIVDYLLTTPQEWIGKVGVGAFSQWLRTPEQFNQFMDMVLLEAIGTYASVDDFQTFEIDYGNIDLEDHFSQIENVQLLSECANGVSIGGKIVGGLGSNPYLPSNIQMFLIEQLPLISDALGGDYDELFGYLIDKISVNPAISPEAISWILENYPSKKYEILQNSKINMGEELVKEMLNENPPILLKNYNLNIRSYINIYKEWLKSLQATPSGDADRFSKQIFQGRGGRYLIHYLDSQNYDIYSSMTNRLLSAYDGINFWRGGNFKKKMRLPSGRNSAPLNLEKEVPMALVDAPIPIPYEHIIWNGSAIKNEEGEIKLGLDHPPTLRHIKEITEQNGLIMVSGFTYYYDDDSGQIFSEPLETTYNNYDEMYGYIPVDRRDGDESLKWENDLTMVFFDVINPSSIKTLPDWRMNVDDEGVKKTIENIVLNPKITDVNLLELMDLIGKESGFSIYSNNGKFSLNTYDVLKQIDIANQWTPDIINAYLKPLFNQGEAYQNYSNLLPTNAIFDLTISEDEDEVNVELSRSVNSLRHIQLWILGENFEEIIPIEYVYSCITLPHISATVKSRAKQIRQKRLAEYLTLMMRDNDVQVNDAEEMHSHEWRIFNSEINNILINYCEMMYPNDIRMQEKLMESIISGETQIGIEEMGQVARGER
tara:strand:- start:8580 stop:13409 length:4830 start_codon:yes stop_codon:yes gene_type:complete